jgi:signal peptidase
MSGSMQPKIKTGSLALVIPRAHYETGNIITFTDPKRPDATTTHRIVEKQSKDSQFIYTTKGDANKSVDMAKVYHNQIIGRLFIAIPYVGYPMAYTKTFPGLLLFVIVPSTILIYEELKKIYFLVRFRTHKYKYGWY